MIARAGRFEGKGVLVTGAGQGLGRAVAEGFALQGASMVILDIESEALHSTADAIRAAGATVDEVVGDVSVRGDIQRAVGRTIDRYGHIDIAVQVAGISGFAPFLEVSDASWQRILDVNLKGTWYLVQESARAMVQRGTRGAIAVTSSTNAFQPEAGGLAYNTSKSGQVAIMRTAAMELAQHGIRVNAIAPGIIDTRLSTYLVKDPTRSRTMLNRIPLGRFSAPAEMARPILWMCSDEASYLSGELMVVDGAMTIGLPEPGAEGYGGDARRP